MTKRLSMALALAGLLLAAPAALYAADAPPTDPGMTNEPADPDAQPYPPDGVTDPNANYPTDGQEGTSQGEDGAPADGGDGAGAVPAPEPDGAAKPK
jgi:hypothetical protein